MGRNRFLGQKSIGAVFFSETATLADFLDPETITIGDKTYEADDDASVIAGNIAVDATGAPDSDTMADRLAAAINANQPTVPVVAKKNPAGLDTAVTSGVRIEASDKGAAGDIAFTHTMVTGTSSIAAVDDKLVGGENSGTQTLHRGVYTVHAVDILLGGLVLPTGLQTVKPGQFEVQVKSSTGLIKAITDLCTLVDNNKIQMKIDGATNIVEGDVVTWNAWE